MRHFHLGAGLENFTPMLFVESLHIGRCEAIGECCSGNAPSRGPSNEIEVIGEWGVELTFDFLQKSNRVSPAETSTR